MSNLALSICTTLIGGFGRQFSDKNVPRHLSLFLQKKGAAQSYE